MASAQEIMSASGPASPLVGRCRSLVETASPLAHTPATLEVVAPPSVPMYTSRPLMPLCLLGCGAYVVGLARVNYFRLREATRALFAVRSSLFAVRWHPLERDVERADTKESDERHASQAGAIDRAEPDLLVWRGFEFDGLPHQRVVSPEAMAPGSDVACRLLAEQQRRERLSVKRQDHLSRAYVLRRRPFNGQACRFCRVDCHDVFRRRQKYNTTPKPVLVPKLSP